MVGTGAGSCDRLALGWTGCDSVSSWSFGQLSDELPQQELAVMKSAVVRNMHGHPQTHGRQLIVKNLDRDETSRNKESKFWEQDSFEAAFQLSHPSTVTMSSKRIKQHLFRTTKSDSIMF